MDMIAGGIQVNNTGNTDNGMLGLVAR